MTKYRAAGLLMAAAASLVLASAAQAGAPVQPNPARLDLGFLKFTVTDLPKMQAFYEKAFGMTQQKRIENPNLVEVILENPGGADLALVLYKDGRKLTMGNAHGPIGFYLPDVQGAYNRAMAAGATSQSAPRTAGDATVAFIRDPEGHEIELLHLSE